MVNPIVYVYIAPVLGQTGQKVLIKKAVPYLDSIYFDVDDWRAMMEELGGNDPS